MTASPLRIAHLINPRAAGDPACLACAALMHHAPSWSVHQCILAMHVDDAPRAECLGLPTNIYIAPRATAPLSRQRQLARIWRDTGATPDILIAWPGTPIPAPSQHIITLSANRLDAGPWPVDTAAIAAHNRDQVRAAWGIPTNARVLLSIAEPAAACDAWIASYLGGVLTFGASPICVVLPAGAAHVDRALRFVERHYHHWSVIIDDAPLPRLLAGADAALHAPTHDRATVRAAGLAWAAAQALPVVAQASSAIDAGATHLSLANIVPPGNRRVLAHAMSSALNTAQTSDRASLAQKVRVERDPSRFAARAHEHLALLAGSTALPLGAA